MNAKSKAPKAPKTPKPLLSTAFVEFVSHLDPREREIVSAKRAESMQEFIRNRSSK